jgi:hypothetical protein
MYKTTYYAPTKHFRQRYRERMSKHVSPKKTRENLLNASETELAKRANYMLLFSIHGEPGATPHTEVRQYFDWDIVIDNRDKTLVTMYINEDRKIPPVRMFGDRKLRKTVYDLWFKPQSKIRRQVATAI